MSVKFGDAILLGLISSSFFSFIGGGKGFALIFQREKDNWARNFKRIKEADAGRVFPMDCQ
jgi:hypothetical protein